MKYLSISTIALDELAGYAGNACQPGNGSISDESNVQLATFFSCPDTSEQALDTPDPQSLDEKYLRRMIKEKNLSSKTVRRNGRAWGGGKYTCELHWQKSKLKMVECVPGLGRLRFSRS